MATIATPSSTPPESVSARAKDFRQPTQWEQMFGFALPLFPLPKMAKQTTKHLVQSSMYPINETLDEYFYNVSEGDKRAVHAETKEAGVVIAGSIVYLAPGGRPVFFPDVHAFLTSSESKTVQAVCIPGVGSSALGAVGLARDVARARNVPVAGVVAGYGFRELVNDTLGGAVYFREINELEFVLENMRRGLSSAVAGLGLLPDIETYDSLAGGPTIQSMKALLRDRRLPKLEFLVGHSKGNMVLSGALSELVCENAPITQLENVTIVLLSAVCALPEVGKAQAQIIGALDGLGWLNSRLAITPSKIVPFAGHHLNREIPFYLDAVSELASI
jgi:hypothetical protein